MAAVEYEEIERLRADCVALQGALERLLAKPYCGKCWKAAREILKMTKAAYEQKAG